MDALTPLLDAGTLGFIGRGALMTLALTLMGCAAGLVLGFLLAVARGLTGPWFLPLRLVVIGYVEIVRRIPFLVSLFIVLHFAGALVTLPSVFWIAVATICLMAGAYLSEIIRAGLNAVARTQAEAAETLNFSRGQTLRLVILPQAWKVILPPTISYMVMFVKDTALVSQIGVFELMFAGKALVNRGQDALLVFTAVLLVYVAISWPLMRLGRWLEHRLTGTAQRIGEAAAEAPALPRLPQLA